HALLTARALSRFKHATSLFHTIQCPKLLSSRIRAALRRGRLRRCGLRSLQIIGGLLHLLGGFGELRIAPIARKLFEFARHLLSFVDQLLLLPLRASSSAALLLHLAVALPAARDLNVSEDCLRAKQLLQRPLLRRHRFFGLYRAQLIYRSGHFLRRLRDVFDELREIRFRVELIAEPAANALGQILGIAFQFLLT